MNSREKSFCTVINLSLAEVKKAPCYTERGILYTLKKFINEAEN